MVSFSHSFVLHIMNFKFFVSFFVCLFFCIYVSRLHFFMTTFQCFVGIASRWQFPLFLLWAFRSEIGAVWNIQKLFYRKHLKLNNFKFVKYLMAKDEISLETRFLHSMIISNNFNCLRIFDFSECGFKVKTKRLKLKMEKKILVISSFIILNESFCLSRTGF